MFRVLIWAVYFEKSKIKTKMQLPSVETDSPPILRGYFIRTVASQYECINTVKYFFL